MFGVFWDCDGTIMDTERLYAYAWQAHLEKYNFFISEDLIAISSGLVLTEKQKS